MMILGAAVNNIDEFFLFLLLPMLFVAFWFFIVLDGFGSHEISFPSKSE